MLAKLLATKGSLAVKRNNKWQIAILRNCNTIMRAPSDNNRWISDPIPEDLLIPLNLLKSKNENGNSNNQNENRIGNGCTCRIM